MALEPLPGDFYGPVLCVIAYETEEEAIRIVNDSRHDLHVLVSGTDQKRARSVASRQRVGPRRDERHVRRTTSSPWGGFKHSSVSRESMSTESRRSSNHAPSPNSMAHFSLTHDRRKLP
jgi:acyl-CoA reductase-like NAD-dependent aldehyde dehydrogenase